ncbi:disulfide bond formation protein B [Oceanimonas pelagia]|uniref:Disulfide bond formation protein B n=1 Tax=Oceanimonas pelagia TaxID=3028314 RepID=A0AA50KQU7_9GAMM|nr:MULTISPECIES: disulfide bond formation protein B [Gammaproteobacteria]WMC12345.1 disulfide bond formation protein B [Oceanimonas pelagia]
MNSQRNYQPSYSRLIRFFGIVSIAIFLITWAIDLTGLTYPCPYCRTQRTIIGILGLILLMTSRLHPLLTKYIVTVLGGYGFVVAAMQHFMGWDDIYEGVYKFGNGGPWFFDEMLLSGGAMFVIVAQVFTTLLLTTNCNKRPI